MFNPQLHGFSTADSLKPEVDLNTRAWCQAVINIERALRHPLSKGDQFSNALISTDDEGCITQTTWNSSGLWMLNAISLNRIHEPGDEAELLTEERPENRIKRLWHMVIREKITSLRMRLTL